MTLRKAAITAVVILTVIFSLLLIENDRSPFPAIFVGFLVLLFIYCFRNIPEKHKMFSYLDQQRAMRAFDRTDSLKFTLKNDRKKKKRKI